MPGPIYVVGLTIYGEARGQPILDQLAVGAVIRERYLRPGWWTREKDDGIEDDTWQATCRDPYQFSCWNGGDANYKAMINADTHDNKTFQKCLTVALYTVNHMTDADVRQLFYVDEVDRFPTHYHTRTSAKPEIWGDCEVIPTTFDSAHIFYTGVGGTPKRRKR